MNRHVPLAPLALGLVVAGLGLPAQAVNLIVNGGFEADTGLVQSPDTINGWKSLEPSLIGGISSLSGTSAPASGLSTAGAHSGANYALLEISQPAFAVLYQQFKVPTAGISGGQLAYSVFGASFANLVPPDVNPSKGLDFEHSEAMLTVRVDILKPGADPLSVANADMVRSYFPAVEYFGSDAAPTGYSSYAHPLTPLQLLAGQTYTLRFASAANTAQALVGIDDVALKVTAVPEPTTWALMLAGLAGMGFVARRRT
jgi:hypothetical protein